MAELTDVTATIWDLTGIDPGFDSFGRSLLPSIADPAHQHRDCGFLRRRPAAGEMQVSEADSLAAFGGRAVAQPLLAEIDIQVGDPWRTAAQRWCAALPASMCDGQAIQTNSTT